MKGIISTDPKFDLNNKIEQISSYIIKDPVLQVSTKEVIHYKGSGFKVALIDYGIKQNIVRSLSKRGCDVYVFPAGSTAEEILNINPDGIMLSNGPGDPKDCAVQIETIKELTGKKPIFGICLGHQLTALANNADTEKLKYGHRGCNHPVKDIEKDLTYITSQNHGYTIIEASMDNSKMEVSHRNMNDGTVEGVRYKNSPVFTVQFHPEASPGPADTAYLFDEFIEVMNKHKNSK
jgi:carbamoyl-phosphate synthase small subunit